MVEPPAVGTRISFDDWNEMSQQILPVQIQTKWQNIVELDQTLEYLFGNRMCAVSQNADCLYIKNRDARWEPTFSNGCFVVATLGYRLRTMADAVLFKLSCDFEVIIRDGSDD